MILGLIGFLLTRAAASIVRASDVFVGDVIPMQYKAGVCILGIVSYLMVGFGAKLIAKSRVSPSPPSGK